MSQDRPPWYRRPLLPPWFPAWLAASLLIGLGFGLAFALGLDDPDPVKVGLVAGAVGFALALGILTFAAMRTPDDVPNPLAPPPVVRYLVMAAVLAFVLLPRIIERLGR